ncbi:MAG: hypothetical protein ACSLFN_09080 [Candidatus Limnocylindrales bacterium]
MFHLVGGQVVEARDEVDPVPGPVHLGYYGRRDTPDSGHAELPLWMHPNLIELLLWLNPLDDSSVIEVHGLHVVRGGQREDELVVTHDDQLKLSLEANLDLDSLYDFASKRIDERPRVRQRIQDVEPLAKAIDGWAQANDRDAGVAELG